MADPLVLDDLQKSRAERKLEARVSYRQCVEAIAAGDVSPKELGDQLDVLLPKIGVTESELVADVAAVRAHIEIRKRRAILEPKRKKLEAEYKKTRAKLDRLDEEHRTWQARHNEAEGAKREAWAPLSRDRGDAARLAAIESKNTRVFGSFDDGTRLFGEL